MSVVEPASTWIVPKLRGWANQMWMRFGGDGVAVYLVGSALESTNPRDVDVVIVLPATTFALRYGAIEGDWPSVMEPEWDARQKVWAREVGKLTSNLCVALSHRLPPDLRVMTDYEQERMHSQKPRIRLDNLEEAESVAGPN